MKMKLFVLVSAAILASMVQASVMTWYVDFGSTSSFTFDSAKLIAKSGNTTVEIKDAAGGTVETAYDNIWTSRITTEDIASFDGTSYEFYVELGNYSSGNWTAVADSTTSFSYSELVSKGVISAGGTSTPAANAWNAATDGFTAVTVPEPGSLGLLLIGASFMLLRRRNRKA